MYDAIKKSVEEMIQEFFQYGIKDALSVDEFLKFREQAVKEQMMGIYGQYSNLPPNDKYNVIQYNKTGKNTENMLLPEPDTKKDFKINQNSIMEKDSCHKHQDKGNASSYIYNKEYNKADESVEEDGFSANEFLAMMKSIED